MALKKTVEFKGITVNDAYIRVWRFEGYKTSIVVGVEFCKDASSPRFDSVSLEVPYSIDNGNPIEQAYTHIKTLPEFAGAIDC